MARRLRRRVRGFTVESLILPLNAAGFLTLSAVKWQRVSPAHFYIFLASSAALYLASAILRVFLGHRADTESTLDRIASGEYEGPITISAALTALSIFQKAPGMWIDAGLLIEGEVLTVVTAEPAPDAATLSARAAAAQEKYKFRFPIPTLLARRTDKDNTRFTGELLTDDFAPVNVYDAYGRRYKKKN